PEQLAAGERLAQRERCQQRDEDGTAGGDEPGAGGGGVSGCQAEQHRPGDRAADGGGQQEQPIAGASRRRDAEDRQQRRQHQPGQHGAEHPGQQRVRVRRRDPVEHVPGPPDQQDGTKRSQHQRRSTRCRGGRRRHGQCFALHHHSRNARGWRGASAPRHPCPCYRRGSFTGLPSRADCSAAKIISCVFTASFTSGLIGALLTIPFRKWSISPWKGWCETSGVSGMIVSNSAQVVVPGSRLVRNLFPTTVPSGPCSRTLNQYLLLPSSTQATLPMRPSSYLSSEQMVASHSISPVKLPERANTSVISPGMKKRSPSMAWQPAAR